MAPTNLLVSSTASIKGNWILGEVWRAITQGAIGSLSWSQEGLRLEIRHKISRRVEGALDVKASNVLLSFCLGVEGGDLGVLAVRDLYG